MSNNNNSSLLLERLKARALLKSQEVTARTDLEADENVCDEVEEYEMDALEEMSCDFNA